MLNFDRRELGNYFVTSMKSLSETQSSLVEIGDHVTLKLDDTEVIVEVINICTDSYSGNVKSSHSMIKPNKTLSFSEIHIFNLRKRAIYK